MKRVLVLMVLIAAMFYVAAMDHKPRVIGGAGATSCILLLTLTSEEVGRVLQSGIERIASAGTGIAELDALNKEHGGKAGCFDPGARPTVQIFFETVQKTPEQLLEIYRTRLGLRVRLKGK